MLGDPTKKTVDMSTDMHSNIQKKHKQGHTLSYPWTYVAPLLVHSPHSLSMCERGENAKKRKGGQFRCVPWKRERRENEIKIHFQKTASCPLQR